MTLFIAWNVNSILWPHDLPALARLGVRTTASTGPLLIISTVIPFVVYYISRAIFTNLKAIRILLIILLIIGAYSAVVSILQFTGPHSLVWPRYILDARRYFRRAGQRTGRSTQRQRHSHSSPDMRWRSSSRPRSTIRAGDVSLLWVIAAACGYGVYLTHTRAVYLAFVLVVIMGALLAKGYRRAFVTTGRRSSHRSGPRLVRPSPAQIVTPAELSSTRRCMTA